MTKDSRLAVGGTRRSDIARALASLTVLVLAASAPLGAQTPERGPSTGDGFLFHKPVGTFSIRGGYSLANASGDLFTSERQQFTIGQRGFDALSLGADLGFNVSSRIDVGGSIDLTTQSRSSEYRRFLDNNDQPIRQSTHLSTVGLSANLKYNFLDRGRSISSFAWIPARYVPYVGIGGGVIHYDLMQDGDFIDYQTLAVNYDKLNASNWGAMGQVFSGLSYTLSPHFSLLTEARYTLSSVKLNKDYSDFDTINLSGLSMNVGTSIRF